MKIKSYFQRAIILSICLNSICTYAQDVATLVPHNEFYNQDILSNYIKNVYSTVVTTIVLNLLNKLATPQLEHLEQMQVELWLKV